MIKNKIEKLLNINPLDSDLFWHGFDIIIYDGIGILCVLLQALLTNNIIHGVLFLICFGLLRVPAGGYHAKTKLSCFLSYNFIFIFFILLKDSSIMTSYTGFIFVFISSALILRFAPVQHVFLPLTKIEKYKNQDRTRYTLSFILILYIILLVNQCEYYKPLGISVIYTALFMLIHMASSDYRR